MALEKGNIKAVCFIKQADNTIMCAILLSSPPLLYTQMLPFPSLSIASS